MKATRTPLLLGWAVSVGAGAYAVAATPPKVAPKKPAAAPAKAAPKPKAAASPKPVAPPPLWAVAFSPDGKRLAVGGYKRVLVFDAATGARTGDWKVSADAVRAVAYAPDGKRLAAATGTPGRGGAAVILEAATGSVLGTVGAHDDTVEALAWDGDGTLLTAAADETVGVADAASGKAVGTLAEHNGRCLSVAAPTKISDGAGGAIWATGGADRMIKIWDARARRVVVNFDQAQCPVWSLAPLARAGAFLSGGDDGRARVFGVGTVNDGKASNNGVPERNGWVERDWQAHDGPVYAVAVAPDGSFYITGGADGKVRRWNPDGGRQREWSEAGRDVWGVAVSPDGKRIAAASLDGRVRVYDAAADGPPLLTLDGKGAVAPPAALGPPAPRPEKPGEKK